MSREFFEQLKENVPISAIVSNTVWLGRHPGRRNGLGLSPFNNEKTSSFVVRDAKGEFHCYSSGEVGDVLRFLQKVRFYTKAQAAAAVLQETGYVFIPRKYQRNRPKRHRTRRRGI